MDTVAGGDYFKIDKVAKEPLNAVLLWLSLQSDKVQLNKK